MSAHVVGIDGGGTRSRGVLLDSTGSELARAEGGPARATASHPEDAAQAVAGVVTDLLTQAGSREEPLGFVWAGLTGAGREESRRAVEQELGRLGLASHVRVDTDVAVAFHDAFGHGPGILLIAGTGSIAWGRTENGRIGRVGGWGHHIGDEGSGYAIGLEALRRVARHADGRAPETALGRSVLAHSGVGDVDGIVSWSAEASKADVASLAKVVAQAAQAGDTVAEEILAHAVEDLESHVLAILTNLGPWPEPPRLALGGGLLEPGGSLREPLQAALERQLLDVVDTTPDGAVGAARLALAALS